jgi:hypothetical protein
MRAMTCRIFAISIAAVQPRVVADFWRAALGWEEVHSDDSGVDITPADGGWPIIEFGAVPETKTVKNRLHLDLRADGSGTREELQRLLDLGARRIDIGQEPDASWVVLADPEGNEFCLLARTVQDVM